MNGLESQCYLFRTMITMTTCKPRVRRSRIHPGPAAFALLAILLPVRADWVIQDLAGSVFQDEPTTWEIHSGSSPLQIRVFNPDEPTDRNTAPMFPPVADMSAHVTRALEHFHREQWPEAMREYMEALRYSPGNPLLLERIAITAALARQYEIATDSFIRFLEIRPDRPEHLAGLAGVLIRQGRFQEAGVYVDRALHLDPENLSAHFNRVIVEVAMGGEVTRPFRWNRLALVNSLTLATWLRQDREEIEAVVSPTQFTVITDHMLGEGARAHLDEIPELLRTVMEGIAAGSDSHREAITRLLGNGVRTREILSEQARLYFVDGDADRARDIMAELTEKFPEDPLVFYNYGLTLLAASQYEDALVAFSREREINPDYADARFAQAAALAGLGQMDAAWPILEQLAEQHPGRMPVWLEGEEPYLVAIKSDPRFPALSGSEAAP